VGLSPILSSKDSSAHNPPVSAHPRRIAGLADHPAVFHLHDAVAISCVSLRVRYLNDARASFIQPAEEVHDLFALRGVKVAGGFVRQNQLGALNDRARHTDQLLLTAGKLVREQVFFANDVEAVEDVANQANALFVRHVFVGEGNFQVLVHGQVVDQVVALKNEPDVGFVQLIPLLYVEAMDRFAVEVVLACPRAVEHPDDAEESGLAGPRGAHKRNKFARLNFQGDAAEDVKLAATRFINFFQVSQLNQRFHTCSLSVNQMTLESHFRFEIITLESTPAYAAERFTRPG
jgi:hypothetical protein